MYIQSKTIDEIINSFGGIKYPPCNATRVDSGDIVIEMAVAGFKPDDISVEFDNTVLTVVGKSSYVPIEGKIIMQGIAARDFRRVFTTNGSFRLESAEMDQGMLKIVLKSTAEKQIVKVVPSSKESLLLS